MDEIEILINDGVLRINGHICDMAFPVAYAIQIGKKAIVLFDIPAGVVKNDNVACFDDSCVLLWTIQPSPHGGTADDPYVSLWLSEDSVVVTLTWSGVEYQVNIVDGTVTASGTRRF